MRVSAGSRWSWRACGREKTEGKEEGEKRERGGGGWREERLGFGGRLRGGFIGGESEERGAGGGHGHALCVLLSYGKKATGGRSWALAGLGLAGPEGEKARRSLHGLLRKK